jgi:hypothetical protein
LGLGGGRRDLWFGRRETVEAGDLGGQGVILLGPGGDQRPQGSIGGKDAVVAVSVDAGWREYLGQAVQKLQGREAQGGAAGGIGLGEQVEDLVGASADQMEAFESEGRPGAIPKEPFQALAVGGLDPDAGVEAESTTVTPCEHVLGIVGIQKAVAVKVTEHPLSNRVLEALQEFLGEGCGFVEAEVISGFR